MAKYQQYESVLLKDGRIATIVEVYEPGAYDADIGDSPEDWATVYGITDDAEKQERTAQNGQKLMIFSQYRRLPIGKTEKNQRKSDELFDASHSLRYNGASSVPGVLRVRKSGRNAE